MPFFLVPSMGEIARARTGQNGILEHGLVRTNPRRISDPRFITNRELAVELSMERQYWGEAQDATTRS